VPGTRPATRARHGPARGGARHSGPGRPLRWLTRRPLAAALLAAGLLAVSTAAVSIALLTGRPGITPRPVASPGPVPAGPVAAPASPAARVYVSRPVYLSIPAIDVHTRLIRLGLTAQGTLQVPASTSVAGWYTGSPRPGQVGSAVIAGHIDSVQGPGVFFRLRLLRPGDRIYVRRAGGRLAVFRVYAEHMYAKDSFPTRRVYGPVPDPELHLITCGGIFDPATGSYLSNVVVYASQIR
jgi:sortase family protein